MHYIEGVRYWWIFKFSNVRSASWKQNFSTLKLQKKIIQFIHSTHHVLNTCIMFLCLLLHHAHLFWTCRVFQCLTRVRSIPSLSWESRWRMTLRWSSRTPRSSSSLSSVSVTSSVGLMSSSPGCCYKDKKKVENWMIFNLKEKVH